MFLVFLLILSPFLYGKPLQVEVSSKAAVLMDMDTGEVLFAKEPHLRCSPASVTKVTTALVFLDREGISLNRLVKVTRESLRSRKDQQYQFPYGLEADSRLLGLKEGEVVSMESLLHGALLYSGNDAANVLAEGLDGSIPRFVDEMNAYVQGLGCTNTQFRNPHGLTHPEQYTTAYDLCLIARRAMQIPQFRQIVSKTSYWMPATNKQKGSEILQINPLLKKGHKHYYPKAIGIKTGYSRHAKCTFMAAAEDKGRRLVLAILGSETSDDRFIDAKALFEAAFAEKKVKREFAGSEEVFKRNLGGKREIQASLSGALTIEFYPSQEPECKMFVHWLPTELPIQKGQKIGELRLLTKEGNLLTQGDLFSLSEVRANLYDRITGFFNNNDTH